MVVGTMGAGESCTSLVSPFCFTFHICEEARTLLKPPGAATHQQGAEESLRSHFLLTVTFVIVHLLNSCHHWMPRVITWNEVHLSTINTFNLDVSRGYQSRLQCLMKAMQGDMIDIRLWISHHCVCGILMLKYSCCYPLRVALLCAKW